MLTRIRVVFGIEPYSQTQRKLSSLSSQDKIYVLIVIYVFIMNKLIYKIVRKLQYNIQFCGLKYFILFLIHFLLAVKMILKK